MKSFILVAEDDSLQRAAALRILVEADYGVREASCAEEAVAMLQENPTIEMLFTDIIMPGLNAFELARLARHRPDLRVLFAATREDLGKIDRQPGVLPGFTLLKPYGRQELISAIDKTLARPSPKTEDLSAWLDRPPAGTRALSPSPIGR